MFVGSNRHVSKCGSDTLELCDHHVSSELATCLYIKPTKHGQWWSRSNPTNFALNRPGLNSQRSRSGLSKTNLFFKSTIFVVGFEYISCSVTSQTRVLIETKMSRAEQNTNN